MFGHHKQAKQACGFACVAGFAAASIGRPAFALLCCLLAGCAASGAGPSPMVDDQNAPPKAESAGTRTADVGSDAKAIAFTVDGISPRRRKQAIADMIESRLAYRARFVEQGAGKPRRGLPALLNIVTNTRSWIV
jgi:hypothetical protein